MSELIVLEVNVWQVAAIAALLAFAGVGLMELIIETRGGFGEALDIIRAINAKAATPAQPSVLDSEGEK